MPLPDLELIITRAPGGETTASLRVELPNRRADLAEDVPISLNDEALRSLLLIPDAYAGALTGMVFVPTLREAWQRALGFAEGAGELIRVRLHLRGDDALHALRWELLRDPLTQTPLAYRERVAFSRYLSSDHLGDVRAVTKPRLRAVVAVSGASGPGLAPVDVAAEVQRAVTGLGEIPATVLDGQVGRVAASLPALADALRAGPQLLYLVCHGTLVDGQPYLYLERLPGEPAQPIPGADFVRQIADLPRRPLLVVLASCRGAGDDYATLAAVGPQLARAGVGAVIAMQGDVPMTLVAALMPRLLAELGRDGQIDRALAAARAALPAEQPWWLPTLWMAVKDGALWHTPDVSPIRGAGVFQVPYPPNPLFRGRDAELRRLAEALLGDASGTAAVLPAVSGTGGIGKTQLASEFAHAHRDEFPGGVFWLSMAQPETVASQVAAAGGPGGLDLPGWSGLDLEARVAAVRRAWNEPVRRLLVFDNLEDPQLLQDWRPTGGGTRLLITTRRGVWSATSGVQAVPLQTLARPESMRLLLAPRYREQVETVLAEPAVAAEADAICEQVGDLPLALALAGAYLEQTPSLSLAGYRARLAESLLAHPSLETELEEGLPTRHAASVAATISLSYQQLNPSQERDALALTLLQRMAYLAPAPIPHRLLIRLAERDPDAEAQAAEVDAPLRRLAAVGLIELLPESGAALHRLVAAFVRDQDADPRASASQAADGLITEVYAINTAGYPLRGTPYLAHLTYLAQHEGQHAAEQAATLQTNLGYLLRTQGELAGARPYYERALAMREQVLGPQHLLTALSLNNLGYLLQEQGDLAGARPYYERALAICEQVLGSQHLLTASSLNNLGGLLQAQGELAGARSYYERALAIYEQVLGRQHPYTALSVNNLGYLLQAQGDLAGARPYFERALAVCEQVLGSQHLFTANSLNSLGSLLQAQGDLAGARSYFERALAIREQTLGPSHPDTANSLNNLGYVLRAQGDLAGARSYFERALVICGQALGTQHPHTANVLNNLGYLLQAQGDLAGARPYYERALAIREQVLGPQHSNTAYSLNNLGYLLHAQGDYAAARPYYERALAIFTARLGAQHSYTQTVQRNLAALDVPQERREE